MLILEGINGEWKELFNKEFHNIQEIYPINFPIKVSWNSRMKTTAGRCEYSYYEETVEIKLNPKYIKFGKERVLGTFKHEVAHAISFKNYRHKGHGKIFKSVCRNIGGTMNEQFAKNGYEDCGTSEYIFSSYKYLYVCPKCDSSFKRKRRISKKVLSSHVCSKCREKVSNFKCYSLEPGTIETYVRK